MTMNHADVAALQAAPVAGPLLPVPEDLLLARAIEQAVRGVPGVQALSAGRFGTAATYGPGGRVTGIVLRRAAAGQVTIEAHLVVSEARLRVELRRSAAGLATSSPETPFLIWLAGEARAAIRQKAADALPRSLQAIDVVIEDIG